MKHLITAFLFCLACNTNAELQALEDEELTGLSGQAGATIEYHTALTKGSESAPQNTLRWKSNDDNANTYIEFQNVYTGNGSSGTGNTGLTSVLDIDVIARDDSSFLVLDQVTSAEKINVGAVNLGPNTALQSVQIFNPSLHSQWEIGVQ